MRTWITGLTCMLAGSMGTAAPRPAATKEKPKVDPIYTVPADFRVKDYWQFKDPARFLGRRSQYETATAANWGKDGRAYFGRRLMLDGTITTTHSRLVGPRSPLSILNGVGSAVVIPCGDIIGTLTGVGRLFDNESYSARVICYGVVDFRPTLTTSSDAIGLPEFSVLTGILQEHLSPLPATASTQAKRLLKGDEQDLSILLYILENQPDPVTLDRAVNILESQIRRLRNNRESAKWQYFQLGRLYELHSHDMERAALCYQRAHLDYAQAPGYQGAAVLGHGRCLEAIKRTGEAKQIYRSHMTSYPNDFWTSDIAVRLQALGVKPTNSSSAGKEQMRESLRQLNRGDYVRSLKNWAALAAASPKDPWVLIHQACAALLAADTMQATLALQKLEKIQPILATATTQFFDYTSVIPYSPAESPFTDDTKSILGNASYRRDGVNWQLVLPLISDRIREYPEDSVAHLLQVQAWISNYVPLDVPDGPTAMARALELAPRAILSRLQEIKYLKRAHTIHGPSVDPMEQRYRTALRVLVEEDEPSFWRFHETLAQIEGLSSKPGMEHQRRFEALKRNPPPRRKK